MENPIISIKNVNKTFDTRKHKIQALQDINMEFGKGELVSIVGPSGCGKSTIIRLIDDIIKPTDGTITVDGLTYDNNKPISKEMIRKLGFIFQISNLYPWLTVRENVLLPLKIHGLSGSEYEANMEHLLKYVDMEKYADVYPAELSGGMSQKAGVIRGMIHKPQMLMMDEPFGALDENTRETLNIELLKIWKETGMTIIFITHNVEEAVLISQRVYVMSSHPGRVTAELKIEFDKPRDLDLITDLKFAEYCTKIENLIGRIELAQIK
jgi:NitT/TauT family transport system ATP-binding protein